MRREKTIVVEQARKREAGETGSSFPKKLPSVTATSAIFLFEVRHRPEIEMPRQMKLHPILITLPPCDFESQNMQLTPTIDTYFSLTHIQSM